MNAETSDETVVDRVAKAIADVVGHGMAEKCEAQARAAIAALPQRPAPSAPVGEDALRDARTIYDIACIRAEYANATREDVEFKAIALRNYNFLAQQPAAVVVDDTRERAK